MTSNIVLYVHLSLSVSRDTTLHKQLYVIQHTGSTHCSGIQYVYSNWFILIYFSLIVKQAMFA